MTKHTQIRDYDGIIATTCSMQWMTRCLPEVQELFHQAQPSLVEHNSSQCLVSGRTCNDNLTIHIYTYTQIWTGSSTSAFIYWKYLVWSMASPGCLPPVARADSTQLPKSAYPVRGAARQPTSSAKKGKLHTVHTEPSNVCQRKEETWSKYIHFHSTYSTLNCSSVTACLLQYQKWLTMSLIQAWISVWFFTVPTWHTRVTHKSSIFSAKLTQPNIPT